MTPRTGDLTFFIVLIAIACVIGHITYVHTSNSREVAPCTLIMFTFILTMEHLKQILYTNLKDITKIPCSRH